MEATVVVIRINVEGKWGRGKSNKRWSKTIENKYMGWWCELRGCGKSKQIESLTRTTDPK